MVYVFRTFEYRLRFYYKVAIIYATDGRIISFVIMVTLDAFQFGWGGGVCRTLEPKMSRGFKPGMESLVL